MTRVLIVEPGYCPYQAAFDSPQAAISEVIEGDSLLLKPFGTSKIGVVCSKNQSRLKYNRQLEDGCTIRGRFLVCGLSESKMLGLSKEQAELAKAPPFVFCEEEGVWRGFGEGMRGDGSIRCGVNCGVRQCCWVPADRTVTGWKPLEFRGVFGIRSSQS